MLKSQNTQLSEETRVSIDEARSIIERLGLGDTNPRVADLAEALNTQPNEIIRLLDEIRAHAHEAKLETPRKQRRPYLTWTLVAAAVILAFFVGESVVGPRTIIVRPSQYGAASIEAPTAPADFAHQTYENTLGYRTMTPPESKFVEKMDGIQQGMSRAEVARLMDGYYVDNSGSPRRVRATDAEQLTYAGAQAFFRVTPRDCHGQYDTGLVHFERGRVSQVEPPIRSRGGSGEK